MQTNAQFTEQVSMVVQNLFQIHKANAWNLRNQFQLGFDKLDAP